MFSDHGGNGTGVRTLLHDSETNGSAKIAPEKNFASPASARLCPSLPCDPQTARYCVRQMDIGQVAKRHRHETVRSENSSALCGHTSQGIHNWECTRVDRSFICCSSRISDQ